MKPATLQDTQPCIICGRATGLGVVCLRRKCVREYQDYLENVETQAFNRVQDANIDWNLEYELERATETPA